MKNALLLLTMLVVGKYGVVSDTPHASTRSDEPSCQGDHPVWPNICRYVQDDSAIRIMCAQTPNFKSNCWFGNSADCDCVAIEAILNKRMREHPYKQSEFLGQDIGRIDAILSSYTALTDGQKRNEQKKINQAADMITSSRKKKTTL